MFSPGETICHRFIIPFVANEISKVIITYKQNDHIVFIKTITSGFEEADSRLKTKFNVTFTQNESLTFKDLYDYYIQINVLTTFGTRATSKEIKGRSGVQYHKEVITP